MIQTPQPLSRVIEAEIEKLLPHGEARKAVVAKAIGMSTRTMSRRLLDEGLTYEAILDDRRRDLALGYLTKSRLPIREIAAVLAYEAHTSLNVAVRRWTGHTPSAIRRNGAPMPQPEDKIAALHDALIRSSEETLRLLDQMNAQQDRAHTTQIAALEKLDALLNQLFPAKPEEARSE